MPRGIFVPVDRTGIPAERETGEGQKRSGTHTMEKKETGCGWEDVYKRQVFDNELSPSQQRVLTEEVGAQVIDRAGLILDIFAQRARTKEGRLQVELAQYKYLLPRLTGMWGHLVRQTASGGKSPIGTRGPGETQLETDRRHIRRKIAKLTEDLEDCLLYTSGCHRRAGGSAPPGGQNGGVQD